MAELVQLHAERSLPELEQLKRVNLFSGEEIRKIKKMRNNFEYKVSRSQKTKENYLKYIQYEIALLNLIKIRRKKSGYDHKKKEIEGHIGGRINNLFKLVIKKFPEDTQLWLSHRQFLIKMKWHENMTGMLSRMLKIHNRNPDLWITVAKWELEENKAGDTARQVLQRAIRFHPESQKIWQEYFRMELIYTDQIRKRRAVLNFAKIDDDASEEVIDGKISTLIFNEAVKTINDVNFALSFMPICKEFDFTQKHQETILNYVKEAFPDKVETWNALARCSLNDARVVKKKSVLRDATAKALLIFEEGISLIPNERMWTSYLQFVLDLLKDASSEKQAAKITKMLLNLFQKAMDATHLSIEMFLEWVRLLHSLGRDDEARPLSVSATSIFPSSVQIWNCCLTLHTSTSTDRTFFFILFRSAIAKVPDAECVVLWKLAREHLVVGPKRDIIEMFELGLSQGPIVMKYIKTAYLEHSMLFNGYEATKELFQRLTHAQPAAAELFNKMIDYEINQFKVDASRVRQCFDLYIQNCGENSVECWLNYAKFELHDKNGKPSRVGKIYVRAIKTLCAELVEAFIKEYTLSNGV